MYYIFIRIGTNQEYIIPKKRTALTETPINTQHLQTNYLKILQLFRLQKIPDVLLSLLFENKSLQKTPKSTDVAHNKK